MVAHNDPSAHRGHDENCDGREPRRSFHKAGEREAASEDGPGGRGGRVEPSSREGRRKQMALQEMRSVSFGGVEKKSVLFSVG